MRRRKFLSVIGGAMVAWPLTVHGQQALGQQPPTPVIGFLRSGTADGSAHLVAAFNRGLAESDYAEGQNVKIEYRWADDHVDRLPALAAELVSRPVAVLFAGASSAALAARKATSTIPIVFVTAADPIKFGLVTRLNRPGGNATGVTYLTSALAGKRLELMHQLVPRATSIAVLANPRNPTTEPFLQDVQRAAGVLGLQVPVSNITDHRELDNIIAALAERRVGGLIVGPDPLFTAHAGQIAGLSARYVLPAIYTTREFALAGGLMTWGTSLTEQYRLGGTYVGKILKGAAPADLPVLQPTKYELVLNLKTAKALGLDIPPTLLALADEVIE
jgi:putative ABC transport system substrate-binding protein